MSRKKQKTVKKEWTAAELLKLPPRQRDSILRAAARHAEKEYRNNPELTDFEAFGEHDLFGESANSEMKCDSPS